MERSTVTIDGLRYPLSQGIAIADLKASIIEAVRAGGLFVDFTVVGNRAVSVFVGPGVSASFSTELIDQDERDTGDVSHPFDELDYFSYRDLPDTSAP